MARLYSKSCHGVLVHARGHGDPGANPFQSLFKPRPRCLQPPHPAFDAPKQKEFALLAPGRLNLLPDAADIPLIAFPIPGNGGQRVAARPRRRR